MTKELADQIESFLKEKLQPEHGFILIIGQTETSNTGIISNYPGGKVVEILKSFAAVAYHSEDQDVRNN